MRLRFENLPIPTKVTAAYAVVAGAWIVFSDGVVAAYSGEPVSAWVASSIKGMVFVGVSAGILRWALRRYVAHEAEKDAELKANDDRWRFALEVAGDGVWDWDGQTGKFYFSPRWKGMLGYAEDEIAGTWEEWESRIHPEDRERVKEHFELHNRGDIATYICEYRLQAKNGAYKWVLARGRVIARSSDGQPLRAIGTHTDITARKESEERMTDALSFLRTILHAAPVGIITYRADGMALSANEAAARFLGGSTAELTKQNFRSLKSWSEHGFLGCADRALQENRPVVFAGRFTSSFGRVAFCEATFTAFRYEGEQRLLLILQDLTEQRATLERMKLLHAALEAAPAGWVVTNAQGIVDWVNPGFTKLTGYTLEESVGRRMNFLKSGRHTPGFYASLWQTIASGQVWHGELYNRRKDGSFYFERMTIAPVRDSEGQIGHFVAMKEDVTGQHELERQLARSQRLESVGLLASGLAHDLNNMLAPIMLSVGLVKARHADRETHEMLDMMQKAAQRGASIVQQILTFARGVEGQRVRVDVRPLIKEMAQLARETFPREIRVVVEVARDPLFVESDVTQLHQVLLNLAVNARDAMTDGGVLTLKAETTKLDAEATRKFPGLKPGSFVRLVVADTGTGITAEVLEHIFEPFFSTKPRGKGTGLGLSTVYGIVRSHGGVVDVQSQLGEGSSFSVLLPATATESGGEPAAGAADKTAPSALEGAGRCVLVVDDEAAIRHVTAQVLGRRGFVTVEAEDGVKALRLLRASHGRYAIAIIDLMMPGMNGYKLIREIREVAPGLPVIVASGMMGDLEAGQDTAALQSLGVRTVLQKPFVEAELLRALTAELVRPPESGLAQNKG